jgi:pimeloyl-ACP methyl ester carboxylesterase
MVLSVIAALTLAVPAAQAKLPLRPCVVQAVNARCGTLVVPEDRARPAGRTIGLRVVVIPSRTKPARPDAFTYLAGGPGGAAATEMPSAALATWDRVHEHHDIVLVDQRGTGGSNRLMCPPPTGPLETDAQRKTYVRSCLHSLKGDPTQYATRAAMDDLDAVRAALGYRTLDIYGTSYGATAAQVYLERHPHSVRTMILDGATFLDVPFFSGYAENGERALDQVVKRCAAQPSCARTFPHWRADLDSLIEEWNKDPVRLPTSDTLTGDGLAGVVQRMTLESTSAASIPLVVSRAVIGDYQPLSQFVGSSELTRSMMYWSIMCNEPWVGLGSTGPWHSYLDGRAADLLATSRTVCAYVPKRAEAAADWARPSSRAPLLVLAGGADPQDPIGNLPGLRRLFPNSRTVVVPGQGHAIGQLGCLGELVGRFVDRGTTRGLDTSCAARTLLAPFVTR